MIIIRFLLLLPLLWSFSTAVPCFGAEEILYEQASTHSFDTSNTNRVCLVLQNLEPARQAPQPGNASEPAWATEAVYSITAHVRNPTVNPGETIEIEVYLSGHGVPAKNKLTMIWSSPYVIDENDPGTVITTIKDYKINTEELILGLTEHPLKRAGNISGGSGEAIVLNLGHFAHPVDLLPKPFPEIGFKGVMGEWNWNGEPPILVKLNTSTNALDGDYQVAFTFTYGYEDNPKQAFRVVDFHVRSSWEWWQEQWQKWAIGGGVSIALVSLLVTAAGTVWQICRRRIPRDDSHG